MAAGCILFWLSTYTTHNGTEICKDQWLNPVGQAAACFKIPQIHNYYDDNWAKYSKCNQWSLEMSAGCKWLFQWPRQQSRLHRRGRRYPCSSRNSLTSFSHNVDKQLCLLSVQASRKACQVILFFSCAS